MKTTKWIATTLAGLVYSLLMTWTLGTISVSNPFADDEDDEV